MTAEQLRNSLLQEAISGRLVPQDPNDEPASVLLEKIKDEKARLIKEGKLKKEKTSAPITDDEMPFEIPASWEWVRISALGTIITGSTPSTQDNSLYGNEYPFYKPTDLSQGYKTTTTKDTVSAKGFEKSRKVFCGSILVTCIGATIGKTGLVHCDGICNQQINAIIPHKYLSSEFIYFTCVSPLFQEQVITNASSTTLPILNKQKFEQLLIPLPPLAEQKRIVAKLEELLPIVEQYGKAQTELDELNATLPSRLRQSILQQAIQGKLVPQDKNEGTAEDLLKQIADEKERLIKEKKLKKEKPAAPITDDEKPFEIPASWEWVRISTLYQTSSGGTPEKGHPEYYGGSIPWVKVGDLRSIYIDKTDDTISEAGLNNSSAKLFPADTILVAMYCNDAIGKSSILKTPMTTNQAICGLYPNPHVCKEYIYYAIQANRDKLQEHAAGGAQKNINQKIVNDMVLPLPPLSEQQRIVAKIEELFALIDDIH